MNGSTRRGVASELHVVEAKARVPELAARFTAARAAWPTVAVPAERFAAYVAERVSADGEALAGVRTSDLYLACGCADGDAAAIAAFDQHYLATIDRALHRLRLDDDSVAEVKQRLRHALLVPASGLPKITRFAGRGDLRRWVRVMAVREALAMLDTAQRRGAAGDDQLSELVAAGDDVEVDYLKRTYRSEFAAAFRQAVEQLPDRERLLLRQHYLDRITVNELARQHGVHRATMMRWLDGARSQLLTATRRLLIQRLDIAPAELDSIMRLIHSQLAVSLSGVFAQR